MEIQIQKLMERTSQEAQMEVAKEVEEKVLQHMDFAMEKLKAGFAGCFQVETQNSSEFASRKIILVNIHEFIQYVIGLGLLRKS